MKRKAYQENNYINEFVITAITEIFKIPIIFYLERRDQTTKKVLAISNPSKTKNIFDTGHIIFMFNENNPNLPVILHY